MKKSERVKMANVNVLTNGGDGRLLCFRRAQVERIDIQEGSRKTLHESHAEIAKWNGEILWAHQLNCPLLCI